jgi:hypothetical protein
MLGGADCEAASGWHNHIHFEPDQLGRQVGEPLVVPLRPTVLNDEVLTLNIAKLVQRLQEDLCIWMTTEPGASRPLRYTFVGYRALVASGAMRMLRASMTRSPTSLCHISVPPVNTQSVGCQCRRVGRRQPHSKRPAHDNNGQLARAVHAPPRRRASSARNCSNSVSAWAARASAARRAACASAGVSRRSPVIGSTTRRRPASTRSSMPRTWLASYPSPPGCRRWYSPSCNW